MQRFRLFLNYPAQPLSFSSIRWAFKLTSMSYREQRLLKAKYRLRLRDLPRLAYEQKTKDLARTKEILELKSQIGLDTVKERSVLLSQPLKEIGSKIKESSAFNSVKGFWSEIYVHEGTVLQRMSGTGVNLSNKVKSFAWLDSFSKFFVKYVNLYHECLQQLVEGHREVSSDRSTRLDDGTTVEEKMREVRLT
mmetsp:Transcript_28525/g.50659  ORF Transcript_28525/g.50659 Transcript_28525/m.50659 type:complete len:193 (-) Transcript_28525:1311-1889(-)